MDCPNYQDDCKCATIPYKPAYSYFLENLHITMTKDFCRNYIERILELSIDRKSSLIRQIEKEEGSCRGATWAQVQEQEVVERRKASIAACTMIKSTCTRVGAL